MSTITDLLRAARRPVAGATRAFAAVSVASCLASPPVAAAPAYGLGTPATPGELARFVSPLPDGRGLPPGSGSVAGGREIYQAQCATCHGDKLQGGTGDRLVGGRGSLVNADPTKAPVKTVESYWPYATTLFDYILRAMPFTAPGSLSHDQAYALSAYILSEAAIVPADAVLDERTLPRVQMPNREGFVADARPERFQPVAETPHTP